MEGGAREAEEAEEAGAAPASGAPAGALDEISANDIRVLGTLRTGYVLVETPRDLRIVDPHALHERLLYERLAAPANKGRANSQTLLVPEVAELSPAEAASFERAREPLEELGFIAESFGGRTAAIRAVPEGVPPSAAAEILREVLDDLDHGGAGARAEPVERVRRSLACRAAVKLGARLDESEIAQLLVDAAGSPSTCPHGRPVWWVLPHGEIARRLGR